MSDRVPHPARVAVLAEAAAGRLYRFQAGTSIHDRNSRTGRAAPYALRSAVRAGELVLGAPTPRDPWAGFEIRLWQLTPTGAAILRTHHSLIGVPHA